MSKKSFTSHKAFYFTWFAFDCNRLRYAKAIRDKCVRVAMGIFENKTIHLFQLTWHLR